MSIVAIKQVDRLLSNPGIDVDELSKRWVAHAVGARPNIVVAMDWTYFDADNQATYVERPRRQVLSSDDSSRGNGAVICPALLRGLDRWPR